ncbi:hypothetical protein [Thalassospira sp.]|uniref:hypothetical protein n=1 Tax=Thalassospira sp. TaxID=1912094 RepID=UPI0026227A42|nr:hypothetical protein [Thalassospira sp.]MCH2276452.1 hypothetical protein [Thalassospira sp.]
MIAWIEQHGTMLQILISFATLLVWIFYAQLLFQSYRRARRPKIVINQLLDHAQTARFLISNMSQEAIHIETVLLCIDNGNDRVCQVITDAEPGEGYDARNEDGTHDGNDESRALSERLDDVTLQGPLPPGKCIELGSVNRLLARVRRQIARTSDDNEQKFPDKDRDCRIEIIVIGVYSSEKGVIGASRTFVYDREFRLRPEEIKTMQHTGFFARREMGRLHSQYI